MSDESGTAVVSTVGDGSGVMEPPFIEIGDASDGGPMSLNLAVGPPSPLTGCYLLIVIGEPYSTEHKDIIMQKLLKGLL